MIKYNILFYSPSESIISILSYVSMIWIDFPIWFKLSGFLLYIISFMSPVSVISLSLLFTFGVVTWDIAYNPNPTLTLGLPCIISCTYYINLLSLPTLECVNLSISSLGSKTPILVVIFIIKVSWMETVRKENRWSGIRRVVRARIFSVRSRMTWQIPQNDSC